MAPTLLAGFLNIPIGQADLRSIEGRRGWLDRRVLVLGVSLEVAYGNRCDCIGASAVNQPYAGQQQSQYQLAEIF